MKISSFKTNAAAVEQGRWIGDLPGLSGVRFKVRGIANADARRLRSKLTAEVPPKERRVGIDVLTGDEIEAKVLLETVLLDWSGIENDDGTPLRYSKKTAQGFLTEPDFVSFRNAVTWAAGQVADEEGEGEKESLGNSSAA